MNSLRFDPSMKKMRALIPQCGPLHDYLQYTCLNLTCSNDCVVLSAADGEEFVSVLTELLFELHVAATPDKLNKVTH